MGDHLPERIDKRKMYFHLLLLISPAFGMPSPAVKFPIGQKKLNYLDSLPNFTLRSKDMYKDSSMYEEIAKDLKEAEKILIELNAELKRLEYEEFEDQKDYFPAYNEAKRYLKETRQGLRKLATRTVSEVRDLKNLLAALDESKDPVLLKVSILNMKNLMIETMETLKEALEKYNSAMKTFQDLNSSVESTNILLGKILAENTPSSCSESYSGFEYFIYCSTPKWFWNTFYPSIPKLRTITNNMMEQGKRFDKTMQKAIGVLNEEIEQITRWSSSADVVSKNIDNYPTEYLEKFESIKENFVTGLDDLQKNAEEFLDQPVNLL